MKKVSYISVIFLIIVLCFSSFVPVVFSLVIWTQTYGEKGSPEVTDLIETFDGGFAIFGNTGDSSRHPDYHLIKTDANGVMEWNQTYGIIDSNGKESVDRASCILQNDDGGYILTGEAKGISLLSLFSSVGGDIWLVKTDSDGNIEWEKTFGSTILEDGAFDVEITDDGGYLVSGFTKGIGGGIKKTPGSPPISKAWIVKTDTDGNIQWEEEVSQGISYHCETTIDGGCIVTGGEKPYADGDAFLVKID